MKRSQEYQKAKAIYDADPTRWKTQDEFLDGIERIARSSGKHLSDVEYDLCWHGYVQARDRFDADRLRTEGKRCFVSGGTHSDAEITERNRLFQENNNWLMACNQNILGSGLS